MPSIYTGELRLFSHNEIPDGWLPCDGQLLNTDDYPALFAIIGAQYGGDGITSFSLPDLRGRVPMHRSSQFQLGDTGGDEIHVLTLSQLPSHRHEVYGSSSDATLPTPANNVWGRSAITRPIYSAEANTTMQPNAILLTGGTEPHNNMQPYNVIFFCIFTGNTIPFFVEG